MPASNRDPRDSAASKRQGLLASALLLIMLAVATLLLTGDKSRQFRSILYASNKNYQSLVKSVNLSDISSSQNSIHDYERHVASVENQQEDEEETDDYSLSDDAFYEIGKAMLEADDDQLLNKLTSRIESSTLGNDEQHIMTEAAVVSPACNPHFNLALPNNQWDNTTKFKRIYFYHARKAGGSTMHKYLDKVAQHYGLELKATEWAGMEEPGTDDDGATFYVTHLREPVSRSISHFKYQGRWDCRDLVYHKSFTPTTDNARRIETWNETGGHTPYECKMRPSKEKGGRFPFFFLGQCAVNCYAQWFSGLCGAPIHEQYYLAKAKVLKYNFVAVIERLNDAAYVENTENFFGVPGLTEKGSPFCERQSHKANLDVPLIVSDDTRERLTKLNKVDITIYNQFTDCLEKPYNFPKWNPNRFELHSFNHTEAKIAKKKAKAEKEGH